MMPAVENRSSIESLPRLHDQFEIVRTLRAEVSRSRRYGNPLSVMVARILPQPQSGRVFHLPSKILASAASWFKNGIRWADSVGLCDEWEFLFVLPDTTTGGAHSLLRKIELGRHGSSNSLSSLRFDARFGVAEWRRGDDETTLWGRA